MTDVLTSPISVILVEDDPDLREAIADYLRLADFAVTSVESGMAFYREMAVAEFDLAVIDLNLPDTDGTQIANFLSQRTSMGIIIVTGRGTPADRLRGFEVGADLYFVKPVDCEELVAAARNLHRRVQGDRGTRADGPMATGDQWTFDQQTWRLVAPNGRVVALTGKESQLLDCLVRQPGVAVSRQVLAAELGYDDLGPESRGLDASLRRLRQKTLVETGVALPVQTMKAVGLVFAAPVKRVHMDRRTARAVP
jgi:DNA-binding response OmpR family regulator